MSVMIQGEPKKSYGLFALAIVLLISGLVVNVVYFKDFPLRSLGLLIFVGGVFLVKASNVRSLKEGRFTVSQNVSPVKHKRPGALAWALSAACVIAIGLSYVCMRKDALAGGHEAWPAYAFAASAVAAAVVWGYVVAKLVKR
jgi:hypothetical protein